MRLSPLRRIVSPRVAARLRPAKHLPSRLHPRDTPPPAAGLAVMDILENEGVIERAAELEAEIPAALTPLTELDVVTEIRSGVGALAAIQLDPTDETLPARAARACREAGVLTRAVGGGALQVSPPLVMTPEHVTRWRAFHAACRGCSG